MSEGIESSLDQDMNLLRLTHIGTYRQRLSALCCYFVCDSAEMVHIAAREYQVRSISRHTKSNGATNTRATSSDHNNFVVQDTVCKDTHDTPAWLARLIGEDVKQKLAGI